MRRTEQFNLSKINFIKKKSYKKMTFATFLSNILPILESLGEVLAVLLPMLLGVAFMTIIERKQLAAHQRRVGPTDVGAFGILQPFNKEWHSLK